MSATLSASLHSTFSSLWQPKTIHYWYNLFLFPTTHIIVFPLIIATYNQFYWCLIIFRSQNNLNKEVDCFVNVYDQWVTISGVVVKGCRPSLTLMPGTGTLWTTSTGYRFDLYDPPSVSGSNFLPTYEAYSKFYSTLLRTAPAHFTGTVPQWILTHNKSGIYYLYCESRNLWSWANMDWWSGVYTGGYFTFPCKKSWNQQKGIIISHCFPLYMETTYVCRVPGSPHVYAVTLFLIKSTR